MWQHYVEVVESVRGNVESEPFRGRRRRRGELCDGEDERLGRRQRARSPTQESQEIHVSQRRHPTGKCIKWNSFFLIFIHKYFSTQNKIKSFKTSCYS